MTDDGGTSAGNRVRRGLRFGDRESASLSETHWLAVALVVVTAGIHLYVGWARARPSLALAGGGFVGGLVLFLVGFRRRLLYALGIGYVAVQIVLWAAFNAGEYTVIGYVDKTVQVVLVGILVSLLRTDAG